MKRSGWITKKPFPPPVFIEYNAVHILLRKYAICVMGGGPRHVIQYQIPSLLIKT